MKNIISPTSRSINLAVFTGLLALTCTSLADKEHQKPTRYQQTNLVSDLAGIAALQDANLVNAWGISFAPSGPFWLSANGSGKALLYTVTNDNSGAPQVTKQMLEVSIP